MRCRLYCCLLLLLVAASAAAATPRIWPFRTTTRNELTPNVVVVQHHTRVFWRVFEYHPGCRGSYTEEYWGWKTKDSRLVVCNAQGKPLTSRRYDRILLTADGQILGLRFDGRHEEKRTAEYVAENGLRTPLADFESVRKLSVAHRVDSDGEVFHFTAEQAR